MTVKCSATGSTERHGPYIDNELQDIYVYWPRQTVDIKDMILQEEEVECVEYWPWSSYCKRTYSKDDSLVPRSEMYQSEFFPWLQAKIDERHVVRHTV